MSNSVKFIPTEISIKRGFIMITFNFEITVCLQHRLQVMRNDPV